MFDILQTPPEIFGRIFELGILNFGIAYIRPVCLVCSAWNDIVLSTPRLWGIIEIGNTRSAASLNLQISKAKAVPLTIIASRGYNSKSLMKTVNRILELSPNWVNADVPLALLMRCRRSDICEKLEVLTLSGNVTFKNSDTAQLFDVGGTPLRLHTFIAKGISEAWIKKFLSPSVTHMELAPPARSVGSLRDTLECISRAPRATFIKLSNLYHPDHSLSDNCRAVLFPRLTTLEVTRVLHPSPLLCGIIAPTLQTLSIQHTPTLHPYHYLPYMPWQVREELNPLRPFMSQWSQGIAVPTMLHTLELVSCLDISDVAFLIRWLARLPLLTRLILHDDAIGRAASLPRSTEETNLLKALASPQGAGDVIGGWLCPSLMELYLGAGLKVDDLVFVGRARGGITSSTPSASQPCRLRRVDATLCSHGTQEEIDTLKSLVDSVICECLACSFKFIF